MRIRMEGINVEVDLCVFLGQADRRVECQRKESRHYWLRGWRSMLKSEAVTEFRAMSCKDLASPKN